MHEYLMKKVTTKNDPSGSTQFTPMEKATIDDDTGAVLEY